MAGWRPASLPGCLLAPGRRLWSQPTKQIARVSSWRAPKAISEKTSDVRVVQTSCVFVSSKSAARLAAFELASCSKAASLSSYLEPSMGLAVEFYCGVVRF